MSLPDADDEALLAALLSGELPLDSPEGQAALDRSGLDRDAFDELKLIADELDYRSVVEEAALIEDAPGSKDIVTALRKAAESSELSVGAAPAAEAPRTRPLVLVLGAIAAAAAALVVTMALRGDGTGEGAPGLDGRTLGETSQPTAALTIEEGRLVIPYALRPGDAMDLVLEGRIGDGAWESRVESSVRQPELLLSDEQLQGLVGFDALRLSGTLDAADGSRQPLFAQPLSVQAQKPQ